MTVLTIVATIWLAGLTGLVAVCRAAAHGDRDLRSRSAGMWPDSHERPLAA